MQQVTEGQQGVMEDHPRSGGAHYQPDAAAHLRLIAVYGAVLTGGFFGPEGAVFQPLQRVFFQHTALPAERLAFMLGPAVEPDHGG